MVGNPNWKKGKGSPNPGGLSGLRRRVHRKFLKDVRDVWEEKGVQSLRDLADRDPGKFIDAVAGLLPKEASIDVQHKHEHAIAWVQAIQSMPPIEHQGGNGEVIEGKAEPLSIEATRED